MCDFQLEGGPNPQSFRRIEVENSVGTILAHDVTEIRKDEFKGRAFRRGHRIQAEDICHLRRLGKEHLFVLEMADDEIHEDEAALELAAVLMGEGVAILEKPREGKVTIVANRDGLFRVRRDALLGFNMLGHVMCATLHDRTVVQKGCIVAGTRAIPLILKKTVIADARKIGDAARDSLNRSYWSGILEVRRMAKPRAGIVITGNEVFTGRVKDSFAPVVIQKIRSLGGDIVNVFRCPDDERIIESRIRELVSAGADLIITTGGMSVDPDDVTRFAIRRAGGSEITYGSAVLPGAMLLVAYLQRDSGRRQAAEGGYEKVRIPVLGVPACAMYHKTTAFDLVLPRILAGEHIGRRELADLGHGGLCMECHECRFPACPFGK